MTASDKIRALSQNIDHLPGIYKMISAAGEVLYVGKAKDLKKRVKSYANTEKLSHRIAQMTTLVESIETIVTYTETEALLLEANVIKKLMPRYNIMLKDGKSPFFIAFSHEQTPRIYKQRKPDRKVMEAFGPFLSGVDEMLVSICKVFLLRTCKDSVFKNRDRPCLNFHIKKCSAPCVDKISHDEYMQNVARAKDFLRGKSCSVQKLLAEEMDKHSENMEYEKAAAVLFSINILTKMQSRQVINNDFLDNADIIAIEQKGNISCVVMFCFRGGANYGSEKFFFNSHESVPDILYAFITQFYENMPPPEMIITNRAPKEQDAIEAAFRHKFGILTKIQTPEIGKKSELVEHALMNARNYLDKKLSSKENEAQALQELERLLDIAIKRIDIFDNSHISGTNPVACMVVAGPDGFIKNEYRKFKVAESCNKSDDYAMMRFALAKRFGGTGTDAKLPSLIIIDGGKGQVSAARSAIPYVDAPIIGIAKGPNRNAGGETIYTEGGKSLKIEHDSQLMYYLERLRDEAHRFAIGYHRARRGMGAIASSLDEIDGIGPARKRALLRHFGSVSAVASASAHDIARVDGISMELASRILAALR